MALLKRLFALFSSKHATLINQGKTLADELTSEANRGHHPRSSLYEVLLFEADVIRAKCDYLAGAKNLSHDFLKSDFSAGYFHENLPDQQRLIEKVQAFDNEFKALYESRGVFEV